MNLRQRAMELYPNHPYYQRQWIRIVRILGDKWLVAKNAAARPGYFS